MATFMDLPRPIRDKIYRLHLLQEKPITTNQHHKITKHRRKRLRNYWHRHRSQKAMPPLLAVSPKIEREAAPIYYGENHFDLSFVGQMGHECKFFDVTPIRHLKFLRTISCTWGPSDGSYGSYSWGGYGSVGDNFRRLSRLKGLQQLNIRVDESDLMQHLSVGRHVRQLRPREDPTPQQQLAILRFPGVAALLSITQVQNVRFIERKNDKGEAYGGLIPGGAIETHIIPRLRVPNMKPTRKRKNQPFRFLDLPPELRNRIYDLIMRIPGPVHPSREKPTTAPKTESARKITESEYYESALGLLLVNKQMHDEAIGLFYNANTFAFYYPMQLQAFLLSIGPQRQQLLRDITIDYYNIKLGGIDLIELALPTLKQLKGLRRLHVVMKSRLSDTKLRQGWLHMYWHSDVVNLNSANPNQIPGVKHLFELRRITDIKIRDVELEKKVQELEQEPGYPDFGNSGKNRDLMQLSRAYEHFNLALVAAQEGNINHEILENPDWHTKPTFPNLKKAIAGSEDEEASKNSEEVEDEGVGEDEDGDEEVEASDDDSDDDFGL